VLIFGRRIIQLVVVFVVVTFFTVLLISLVPGKPEQVVIPFDNKEQTQRKAFRHDNNLDDHLVVQWAKWAGKFVKGDFGNYYGSTGKRPVGTEIKSALPVSLLLMLYTQVFSLIIAVPTAVWAAYRNGKWIDKILSTTAFGFISVPNFAVALLLSYYVGVKLGWVPAQGYTRITEDPVQHFKTMVIPVIALSLGQIAVYMRLLRTDLIRTLQEDFILMAKAKGISDRRVLWRHALRPSSLTLLTVAGLNVGTLIGGAVVIEYLLNIPGMGYLIGYAIAARQYIALQSAVAVIAIGFVLVNFLIDFLYTVLDPRIRENRA
jgi:peptide/nickel transport system permease protein